MSPPYCSSLVRFIPTEHSVSFYTVMVLFHFQLVPASCERGLSVKVSFRSATIPTEHYVHLHNRFNRFIILVQYAESCDMALSEPLTKLTSEIMFDVAVNSKKGRFPKTSVCSYISLRFVLSNFHRGLIVNYMSATNISFSVFWS